MNIHASCVNFKGKGILLLGDSGFGKSEMCLRLIYDYGAVLVADDRVDITIKQQSVYASVPQVLAGLLEVRGIGIIKLKYRRKSKVDMVVKLTNQKIERLPEKEFYDFDGIKMPQISINPQEHSAPAKILAGLSLL